MKLHISLIMIFLSGCATQYQLKETENTASLYITGNNRNFFVEAYDDHVCTPNKNGIRLATFFGPIKDVAQDESGKRIVIPAGKPFIFTHYYVDARIAQNRKCGLTVSFTPEAGKAYETYFYVDPDVTGCDSSISDRSDSLNGNVPSFKYNENYCLNGSNKGDTNGRPTIVNWRVKINRINLNNK